MYTHELTGLNSVVIRVEVEVGRDTEAPEMLGVAHILEHAAFRHPDIPDQTYMDLFKDRASDYNGYTMDESTWYTVSVLTKPHSLVHLQSKGLHCNHNGLGSRWFVT